MKRNLFLSGGLVAILTTCCFVQAQPVTDSSGKLNEAALLLSGGKPKEARVVIATIDRRDTNYVTARGLDALCLYRLDKRKFLDSLESGQIQSADMPAELREELDYRQIDTLLFYRKFEELLPKIGEFSARHGDSSKFQAVGEYQMAALFERGTKKLIESAQLKARNQTAGAEKRLQEGQDNLEQFLKLAADGERNSYQTLTNRDLSAEVVKVLAALGGDMEALKMVPPEEREDMALAVLKLHNKINSDAADFNLRRMTNFLNDFPKTKYRQQIQFQMGEVALNEGWRLTYEQSNRTNAAPYLNMARDWLKGLVESPAADISEADLHESRVELLRVYYAQTNWAGLSAWAAQMQTNAEPGGKDWLAAKLYDAAGLACQEKLTEAASELDELMAIGFKKHPSYDGRLVSVAEWRIIVAKKTGDEAKARQVAQLVQNSNCYGSLKRAFLKKFASLLAQPNSTAK